MSKLHEHHGKHYNAKCSVAGCQVSVNSNTKISLHKFPLQPERRLEWLTLIGRLDLVDKINRGYVCTKHFSDAQYSSTLRTRLSFTAVPELYLPDPKGEKDGNGEIKIVHMPRVYEPSNFWYEPGDSSSCYKTMCLPAEEDTVVCPEITVVPTQQKPEPPVVNLEVDLPPLSRESQKILSDIKTYVTRQKNRRLEKKDENTLSSEDGQEIFDFPPESRENQKTSPNIKTYVARKKNTRLEKTENGNILSSQDGHEIYVKCEPMDEIDLPSDNAECIPDLNNVPETDSSVLYDIGYMDIAPKCELAEIDDQSATSSSPGLQDNRRTFTKSADRNIKTILKEIKAKPTASLTKDDIFELVNEVTKREHYISSIEKSLVDKAVTIQQLTLENARLKKKLSGKC